MEKMKIPIPTKEIIRKRYNKIICLLNIISPNKEMKTRRRDIRTLI
jgi:hypothetical protein